MSRLELTSDGSVHLAPEAQAQGEEFPDLFATRGARSNFDPSRNRFANAVKRGPAPVPIPVAPLSAQNHANPAPEPAPLVPRPSKRVKLRPPTLLPTLRTGAGTNDQYMAARATAIRLGHARNACLARAADAFRRGDGAAAKRFSREGKSLNERMLQETAQAAEVLVRQRREDAQKAIRERDPAWSDDPLDRSQRGKECAGGLGVVMGVAGTSRVPGMSSSDERTECLLDLHTLHGPEGQEVLTSFLTELDKENFRGLGEWARDDVD